MKTFYENRTYDNQFPLMICKNSGFDFLAHWHNDIEMVYVLDGNLKMGINKEQMILKKGDFAVCSSGDIHYYDSKDLYSEYFLVLFKPQLLESKSIWPVNLRFLNYFVKNEFFEEKQIDARIQEIFNSMYCESQNSTEYSHYFKRALLYELCGLILSHIPTEPMNESKMPKSILHLKTMQTALQYLETNYARDIGLEEIARTINISPFYFSRLFNQITGKNFKTYLNSVRIEKAEEILLSGIDKSITEIAYDTGFGSVRTFNRVFKSIKGHIPSDIRYQDRRSELI